MPCFHHEHLWTPSAPTDYIFPASPLLRAFRRGQQVLALISCLVSRFRPHPPCKPGKRLMGFNVVRHEPIILMDIRANRPGTGVGQFLSIRRGG